MPNWHIQGGIPEDTIKGIISVAGDYDLEAHVYSNAEQEFLKMSLNDAQRYSAFHNLPKEKFLLS